MVNQILITNMKEYYFSYEWKEKKEAKKLIENPNFYFSGLNIKHRRNFQLRGNNYRIQESFFEVVHLFPN